MTHPNELLNGACDTLKVGHILQICSHKKLI